MPACIRDSFPGYGGVKLMLAFQGLRAARPCQGLVVSADSVLGGSW